MSSPRKKAQTQLPIRRIRTIMKSSPNVESIGVDSLHMVTKCTELFVHYLSSNGLKHSSTREKLDYKGIATFVNSQRKLGFLSELIPFKMKVRDIRTMLENGVDITSMNSQVADEEEEDDEEEEEEEEEVEEGERENEIEQGDAQDDDEDSEEDEGNPAVELSDEDTASGDELPQQNLTIGSQSAENL